MNRPQPNHDEGLHRRAPRLTSAEVGGKGNVGMTKPSLQEQLKRKILILDGAMGTMLQQGEPDCRTISAAKSWDGCNEKSRADPARCDRPHP